MNHFCLSMWKEDDGVLAFEWTLIMTILVFGIVAGLTAARDAIIDEFGDVAQAMLALDHSMSIDFPLYTAIHTDNPSSASDSSFTDAAIYSDCTRNTTFPGQGPEIDNDS